MPNWCHNKLLVEGDMRELKRFRKRVCEVPKGEEPGDPLYFSSLVPEPENPDDPSYDWYGWRIENWGTKWEPSFADPAFAFGAASADPGAKEKGRFLEEDLLYEFDTAWSPPSFWVEKASKMFPALRFTLSYAEVGNGFAGIETFVAGKLIQGEDKKVEEILSPDEMWF
jgi:hypothetical protein